MDLISRMLGTVSPKEMDGIRLDKAVWELDSASSFSALLAAIRDELPPGAMLYFEGGSPDSDLREFLSAHAIPEPVRVAKGTIWPRPLVFHVPATPENLDALSVLMIRHAEPELAVHFHVYSGSNMVLQWYDAFSLPIQLSGLFTEAQVARLARALGTLYRRADEEGISSQADMSRK